MVLCDSAGTLQVPIVPGVPVWIPDQDDAVAASRRDLDLERNRFVLASILAPHNLQYGRFTAVML